MSKAIPRGPLFRIDGIEPSHDVAWHFAGAAGRKKFWSEAMRFGLLTKDASLSKGLSIEGERMRISERTRKNRRSAMGPAYYRAPALTPSFEASRTRSYLRAEVIGDGVTFWWRFDPRTKDSWGVILEYQKHAGRNVIGLSSDDLDKIYRHMQRWWVDNRMRLGVMGAATHHRKVGGSTVFVAAEHPAVQIARQAPMRVPLRLVRPRPVPVPDWKDDAIDDKDKTLVESSIANGGFFSGFRRPQGGRDLSYRNPKNKRTAK